MFRVTLLLALACVLTHSALADTTWVAAGQISGNWTAPGSPFMIAAGNDTIATGAALEIGPGVKVSFAGPYRFVINGSLRALGTEEDSIYFTTDTLLNNNRWRGLRFDNSSDSCRMDYCVIEHGRAVGAGDDRSGGAIECRTSRPTMTHCRIRFNYAQIDGGGIYCQVNSAPFLSDCELYYNTAQFGGGGAMLTRNSTPILVNCEIHDNSSPLNGGGLMFRNVSLPSLTNCYIHNNQAGCGGGVYSTGSTTIPTFTNCTISDNVAQISGGGVGVASGAAQLYGCLIRNNSAQWGGGVSDSVTGAVLRNCVFTENLASVSGGAVSSANGAATHVTHCTFLNNSNANLWCIGSAGILENNIIAFTEGAGIYVEDSPAVTIAHNDFYANTGGDLTGAYPESVGIVDTVNLNGDPCDQLENLFLDPLFVNLPGSDLHLTDDSPCISAGQASNVANDFDGHIRPNPAQTQPDLGAFESAVGGDLYACGELSGSIGPAMSSCPAIFPSSKVKLSPLRPEPVSIFSDDIPSPFAVS